MMGALGSKRRVALAITAAIIGALAVLVAIGASPGEGFAPGVAVEAALAAVTEGHIAAIVGGGAILLAMLEIRRGAGDYFSAANRERRALLRQARRARWAAIEAPFGSEIERAALLEANRLYREIEARWPDAVIGWPPLPVPRDR